MKEIMIIKKKPNLWRCRAVSEKTRSHLQNLHDSAISKSSPPPRLAVGGGGGGGQGGGARREWVGTDAVTEGTESFFVFLFVGPAR